MATKTTKKVVVAPADDKKETKTAAKTTATKTAAKKTTAAKKPAAKKTAAKKENNVFVEFVGNQTNVEDIKKNAIADYKAKSGKKTTTSVNIYVKPEDGKAYYVIDDVHGDVAL